MSEATRRAGIRAANPLELDLPTGRRMALESRGEIFYREVAGPPGAPTLVLLHGWVASGGLNWFQTFDVLSRHFRIIAPDMRGHARGIRSPRRFRLADCADDVAALVTQLGVGPVIAVGYSMGGPIAQLLWRRHPEVVAGLVLCATGHVLLHRDHERIILSAALRALTAPARVGQLSARLPGTLARQVLPVSIPVRGRRSRSLPGWAAAEMARHDWRMLLEAGLAISRYDACAWIGGVDVPTSVVVTTRDRTIGAGRQMQLAASIPDATVHPVEGGHISCARPEFATPLLRACTDVAERV